VKLTRLQPEFAHPWHVLHEKVDLIVASTNGGNVPVDPNSVTMFASDGIAQDFLAHQSALWENTAPLSSFLGHAKEFDAIYFVGGHGPMLDLATNKDSQALIAEFYESGRIVSAVCHGPAALVNVKLSDGEWLIAGAEVTGFSNAEEDSIDYSKFMPFMLEDELNQKSGGHFVKAEQDWGEKVVVAKDGRLITGQNPFSATKLAHELYDSMIAHRK
jgi:putative intracellular protease/amidase